MSGGSAAVKAYCIDPHDLVVAKLAAARDKDRVFIQELIARKLVDTAVVRQGIETTPVSSERKASMQELFLRLVDQCERLAGGAE